jgi:hypothetical protein
MPECLTIALDSQIRARIEAFAAELGALLRQYAVELATAPWATVSSPPARAEPAGPGTPRVPLSAAPAVRPRAPKPVVAPRGRRSSEDVQKTAERVQAHVRANPGQRMEEISAALNVPTGVLTLPRLQADGHGQPSHRGPEARD